MIDSGAEAEGIRRLDHCIDLRCGPDTDLRTAWKVDRVSTVGRR